MSYPEGAFVTFRDGDQWCCVRPDFENLQESKAGFGNTVSAAYIALQLDEKQRQEYVICYVPIGENKGRILLIEKRKPEWQAGMFNLPGGKVEPGESPLAAASRELMEEAGLLDVGCYLMGQLSGPNYIVHVAYCIVPVNSAAQQMEEEIIHTVHVPEALAHPKLIPNLKVVIPLCAAGVKGWDIQDFEAMSDVDAGHRFVKSFKVTL